MLRKRLNEILTPDVIVVSPTTPVSQAIRIMWTKNISCIVILEENKPIGIFTERNVAWFTAQRGADVGDCEIRELMSSPVLTVNKDAGIYTAYNLLETKKIRHLVVVDHEDRVVGVVTQSNMIEHLGYEYFIEIKKVSQIMTKILLTISKGITVYQALTEMARSSVSCLIIAQDDRPLGILTERDVGKLLVEYSDISQLKVEEVMSSPVQTASRDTPVHEVAKIMKQENIRRVVVIDKDSKIVGLATQSDIVKGLEARYIETLRQLIKEKDVKIESTLRDLAGKTVYLDNILRSSIYMGIVATDLDFRIAYFNPGAEQILGYSAEEVIGRNAREIHFQKNVGLPRFDRIVETIPENKIHTFTFEQDRREGKRFIHARASGIWDKEGKLVGFVLMLSDITERKRAEEQRRRLETQLQQTQRMEAIGTLAGGIAHEFNNALVGISGNIELLQMNLADDKNRDEYVGRMKDSTRRMVNLTNQLLAYARGGKYQPKNISLNAFVIDLLPLVQHIIDPAIRVETDLPDDISNVEVDLTQMQMMLFAVLNNAAEAAEGKGRIRIITRDEKINDEFVKTHPGLKPGLYVCLTIEDEGKGMDKQTRDRVFEPFFTTKFQGRGLGMAAAYGIIRSHGGSILIHSELGKGTEVRIYLPVVEVLEEEAEETKAEVDISNKTILVIEDEDVVMDVIRPMLEGLGYHVLPAKTGSEAVEIARTFEGDIDLAILDIILPDMSGENLYPLIMEALPNLKVIVCSGYAVDGPAQEILDAGAQDFIQKPFSLETLSKKLRKVLTATI